MMFGTLSGNAAFYGVMGWPVAHSLSPTLHNMWYKQCGIDAIYLPFAVAPDRLADAVVGLQAIGCKGWNVTVPYKTAIVPYLATLDAAAQKIGAVNTVVVRDDGLHGYNTDANGYRRSLEESAKLDWRSIQVLVLGAGGAARAVVYALLQLGVPSIMVSNRSLPNALSLQRDFPQLSIVPWHGKEAMLSHVSLLINTTTVGLHGETLPLNLDRLPAHAIVSDLLYKPRRTPLLQAAEARGLLVINGLGMLVYQAAEAFSLWLGQAPSVSRETIIAFEENL